MIIGDDCFTCGQHGQDLRGDDTGVAGIQHREMAQKEVHWDVELDIYMYKNDHAQVSQHGDKIKAKKYQK